MTRRRKLALGGFVGLVVIFFLMCCSGLLFPIRHATEALDADLKRDVGVGLPTGATVARAVRVATNDPARYYELRVPSEAVMPFITAIRTARGVTVQEYDEAKWSPRGPAPAWWKPAAMPNVRRMDVGVSQPQSGYVFFYSPSSATVLVFWFET